MQVSAREAKLIGSEPAASIIRDLINGTGFPVKNLVRLFYIGISYDIIKATVERIPNFSVMYVDIAYNIFQEQGKVLFKEYLDLGFPQQVINFEGAYISHDQWPSLEENAIIASPLGSGKSTCIIQKIKENPDKKIVIVCPRNEICDQYAERLYQADIVYGCVYADHRDKVKQVMITNFDRFPYLTTKNTFDWVVVDEFHALCDDDLYRDKQNIVVKNVLQRALSYCQAKVHFVSATPKRSALESFKGWFNFNAYIFVSQEQPKPLTFYVSSDPAITALDLITKTTERCIIHQNNITSNNKLAAVLQEENRKCTSIHAGTRELLQGKLDDYSCIFVTSFIDSGKSIDDGILSKVFTIGSRERLSSILQRVARVRENVSEYSVILKKTNTKLQQGEPFQVWNGGMWNFDKTNIPDGWSSLHNNRADYIQKDIPFITVECEYALIEQMVNNPNLIKIFNEELSQRFGFYIDEVNYDYESIGKFSIDIFVKEFKQLFEQGIHKSDIAFLLSAIQTLGYMQKLPPALNAFFDYMVLQGEIDIDLIRQISERFLILCRGERTIVSDAQREIAAFCMMAIQTYGIPDNDLIPPTIGEWMDKTPRERSYLEELGTQMLTSMACVADPEYIRAPEEDPVQFNVGQIFKQWIHDQQTDGFPISKFSISDIELYIGKYIRRGWIPAHECALIGNPNLIELNKIYRFFKASLGWVSDKIKVGRNVFFVWSESKYEEFSNIIKQYCKVETYLKSDRTSFSFKKYENLHRHFHLCYPLFVTLSKELS